MNSFSRKPSGLSTDINAFIEGAEKRTEKIKPSVVTKALPWDEPHVREDMVKTFNIRLPEPYHLKLAYIAEHMPQSMHNFCLDILKDAIDAQVDELTRRG